MALTLKYGEFYNLREYEGSRELKDLTTFADTLSPMCTIYNLTRCSPEQHKTIVELESTATTDIKSDLESINSKLNEIQNEFKKSVDKMQKIYTDLQIKQSSEVELLHAEEFVGIKKSVIQHRTSVMS